MLLCLQYKLRAFQGICLRVIVLFYLKLSMHKTEMNYIPTYAGKYDIDIFM